MVDDEFWKAVEQKHRLTSSPNKIGVLNIALLFGTAAIALTLILTPMLSGQTTTRRIASNPVPVEDYDNITTGSVTKPEGTKRYTIRRSVLQEQPGSVCIVEGYGANGSGC